jgi:FixJ family two-component response regulator
MPKAFLVSIVEDDRFFRESMSMLLESLGYSVETFSSAADFLARIIHDSTSFFISTRCTRAIYLS